MSILALKGKHYWNAKDQMSEGSNARGKELLLPTSEDPVRQAFRFSAFMEDTMKNLFQAWTDGGIRQRSTK